jgi:ABC-type Zn uptake system ZnuABC Zn-binding protein ZnuA
MKTDVESFRKAHWKPNDTSRKWVMRRVAHRPDPFSIVWSRLRFIVGGILVWCTFGSANAGIRVVTTIPDLADLAKQVGGSQVEVDYIVRGDQNPHFIDVKPSYMMKLRSADIFLMIGMELELWAPQIIDGSRNADLEVVDLSEHVEKLEVPQKADASQGDVHRFGNPHYWLDPRNIQIMVGDIVNALVKVAPQEETYFRGNAEKFLSSLTVKITEWESAMKTFQGFRVLTFHKSWSYFARWLDLVVADQVEPKPGLQPSPSHTANLIKLVREGGIKAIIVEPFHDAAAAESIARLSPARVVRLATSVGGVPEATSYTSMMDYNIRAVAEVLR